MGIGSYPDSVTKDFNLEVSKGNVPGHENLFLRMASPVIGSTFSTLWDIATPFVWPTAGEALEISSLSGNDTAAGSGARQVIIVGLDDLDNEQVEVIAMNGATKIPTVNTNWGHVLFILVTDSGASNKNEGVVTLQVAGGGNVRATMLVGKGRSFNGFYVAPAGKTAFIRNAQQFTPKGQDHIIEPLIRTSGSNTWASGGEVPTYQNQTGNYYESDPRLNSGDAVEFQAKTTNDSQSGSILVEITEVENNLAGAASARSIFI